MIKLDSVTFSYEYGDETFTVHTRRSIKSDLVSLNISTEGDVFTASLDSSEEITITELTAVFRFGYCETDRIFLNGYQSWTDSIEHSIYDKMRGIEHKFQEICFCFLIVCPDLTLSVIDGSDLSCSRHCQF